MFQASVIEKIETYFEFSNCSSENHAFNGVMWRNVSQPEWPRMTV